MRLRSLQALRAVMETGSVTQAAERLSRTQPQVSRLIGALEGELGFKLFVRERRRLIPTREGQLFYREAQRILNGLDEVSRIADEIRISSEARLRVIAQPYLAHGLVPAAFARFAERHPRVRYSLEVRSRGDVGTWISGHQFDLGVAALPIDVPAVVTRPFAEVAVLAALPLGHPLASEGRLAAEDLAREPFIALKRFTLLRHRIDEVFEAQGLELDVRAETSSGLSSCQLVAQGLGITLADPLIARALPDERLVLRQWTPGVCLTYGFVYSAMHPPSDLADAFACTVAKVAREIAPDEVRLLD